MDWVDEWRLCWLLGRGEEFRSLDEVCWSFCRASEDDTEEDIWLKLSSEMGKGV